MSTLYIKNGKIYINYSENGKQIRRSLKLKAVGGKIPLEAKRIQQQIDERIALAPYGLAPLHEIKQPKKISLDQFKNEVLAHSVARKSKTTADLDRYRLETLISYFGKDSFIQDISVKQADTFVSSLIKDRRPYTVNSHIRSYRALFNVALKWKYIRENPFKEVKFLPVEDPLPRVLEPHEIEKLTQTVEQHFPKIVDYFYFYLLTGCRMSEAVNLQWHHIDFDNNRIRIEKTKNHRSRIIIMARKVKEILLKRRILERPFPEYVGNVDELSKAFTSLCRAANISDASLKSLRSNFASYLASIGMAQSLNEKLLGHTELVSKKHYLNFVAQDVQDKIQLVEEQLLPKGQQVKQQKNSTNNTPRRKTA